jgi:hypothetical protein
VTDQPGDVAGAAAQPAARKPAPAATVRRPTDLAQFYGKSGKPQALNADGTVNCRNCGKVIEFLPPTFPPEDLPAGAPRTVNHTGCPKATPGESPAEPDAFPPYFHETINVIDAAEVAEFYADKAAFAKKRGG